MADEPDLSSSEPSYALTLDGNGIVVTRDIPESVARTVIALVMGGGVTTPSIPMTPGVPAAGYQAPVGAGVAQSVREFLDGTDAKRNPDKIVAIASYLKSQGQLSFSRDEVKQQFPKAGEAIPGNYARDFALAVSTGWIAEHGNTGSFYITAKGEKAVTGSFGDKIRRPTTRRKSRKSDNGDES